MKIKHSILMVLYVLLISCSNTLSTVRREYKIKNTSQLKSDWIIHSKEWYLENNTLVGTGNTMHWGVIESKKELPINYEITLKANMTKESLFEIMLNSYQEQYIRTYLYEIDQNIVIGRGKYKKGSDEYDLRGGPSLFTKPMQLENNKWYTIKIKVLNNQLYFSVDNETKLECSLEKNNLNQKGKLGFITNGEVKITDLTIKSI